MRLLIPKKAVTIESVPLYFQSLLSSDYDLCMFTPEQLQRFKAPHLEAGIWFLECHRKFTPEFQKEERQSIDAALEGPTLEEGFKDREAHNNTQAELEKKKGMTKK